MKYRVEREGKTIEIDVELTKQGYLLRGPDGQPHLVQLSTRSPTDPSQRAITPWGELEVISARRGNELWATVSGRRLSARVERARPLGSVVNSSAGVGTILAPMAGRLLRIDARVGDAVKAGQTLAVIEAMKMENELVAPVDGVVVEVASTAPSPIDKGALIARLEPR